MTPDFSHCIWTKSSRSDESGGAQCIEVASTNTHIGVRDSKAASTGHLTFTASEWRHLLIRIKAGTLDL